MKSFKEQITLAVEFVVNVTFYVVGLLLLVFAIWYSLNPTFVGNNNTKVLHKLDCSSVEQMKDSNKTLFSNYYAAIDIGYRSCQRCHPLPNLFAFANRAINSIKLEEDRIMFVIVLVEAVIIVIISVISAKKTRRYKDEKRSLEKQLSSMYKITSKLEQDLSSSLADNNTLSDKLKRSEEKATKFYRLSNQYHMETFRLNSQIRDAKKQHELALISLRKASLFAYWPVLTSPTNSCKRLAGGEPVVIVSSANKFHKYVHGNWENAVEMPLQEALEHGAIPCEICIKQKRPK